MVAHESGLSHPTTALGRWARRIVSEDSVHSVASLSAAVHPFPESKNLTVVLVATEILKRRASVPRKRHTSMKLPSPSAKPDKKLPSEAGMASMHGLSC
jgi:hypothetical protein